MAVSNRERVGKGLDLLAAGLRPFVERELKAKLGDKWASTITDSSARPPKAKNAAINLNDPQILLGVMIDQWQTVFRDVLGQQERSIVHELKTVRNQWAHNEQFTSNDAIRALDSMERLLCAVSAADTATEVGQMRMDVMRTLFDDQRRQEMRRKSFQPTEGKPQGGLKQDPERHGPVGESLNAIELVEIAEDLTARIRDGRQALDERRVEPREQCGAVAADRQDRLVQAQDLGVRQQGHDPPAAGELTPPVPSSEAPSARLPCRAGKAIQPVGEPFPQRR